jgi:DNA modification methylase
MGSVRLGACVPLFLPMPTLLLGNCLEKLAEMADCSIDAIVTDPPYGLSFMGKKWDYDVPGEDIWRECLRVLKPGGHLLAFAGTRTQHRMAVRIEDAGFEIRDMIAWVYSQGFPKSHNLKGEREGFGTALKPSLEPITMARKPLQSTVAANVLEHGTGALNIDGCRVGKEQRTNRGMSSLGVMHDDDWKPRDVSSAVTGRWPANLIHDGSDEVMGLFPQTGISRGGNSQQINAGTGRYNWNTGTDKAVPDGVDPGYGDSGSAARFFYCAKTSKRERGEGNNHPTVKPIALMRYLCRLVTPPGGTVLDPFMGSGSTGMAAEAEGFDFVGIELDPDYFAIAQQRITNSESLTGDEND